MKITLNKLMKNLVNLSEIGVDSIVLLPELREILDRGILHRDEIYVLNNQILNGFTPASVIENYFDKTDLECDTNHVHIGDYVNSGGILLQGIKYAFELSSVLEKIGEFEIILSYSTDPIEDCSVRFHKIRSDESPYLLDDIEGYKLDAVLVIITQK